MLLNAYIYIYSYEGKQMAETKTERNVDVTNEQMENEEKKRKELGWYLKFGNTLLGFQMVIPTIVKQSVIIVGRLMPFTLRILGPVL